MDDVRGHGACVEAWLRRLSAEASSLYVLRALELALNALWTRTKTTLGEVTLTAIAERVLHTSALKFPCLSAIKVDPAAGISCRYCEPTLDECLPAELRQCARFVLVEFLSVLGGLTAEILTPELHSELGRVALPAETLSQQGGDAPASALSLSPRTSS